MAKYEETRRLGGENDQEWTVQKLDMYKVATETLRRQLQRASRVLRTSLANKDQTLMWRAEAKDECAKYAGKIEQAERILEL